MYGFREAAIEKVPMVEAMVQEEYLVLQFLKSAQGELLWIWDAASYRFKDEEPSQCLEETNDCRSRPGAIRCVEPECSNQECDDQGWHNSKCPRICHLFDIDTVSWVRILELSTPLFVYRAGGGLWR